jgi:hypothetical protein
MPGFETACSLWICQPLRKYLLLFLTWSSKWKTIGRWSEWRR